ncbi:hypothetical protein ELH94_22615 [Rhizobium leguminosarum]|uniref:hypothetical protein n=1 Tax=Rhizobium leguminosarum TaxID=384 RepID=UPI00103149C9|nr:hypothetical protein [Rhizobium leguminosarum]TAX99122.1 hypothetical protein ELH94_22615 [Rhizobium leguminosarum]
MFQPKLCLMALVLLQIMNEPANAGSKLAKAAREPDKDCRIVNQAYVNTRNTVVYGQVGSFMEPDGLRLFHEGRVTPAGAFERYAAQTKWTKLAEPPPAVTPYLRFTDCTYLDGIDGPHFRAYWHNPPQHAEAEVWLTADYQKLSEVRRHFAIYDKLFPSETLATVWDYDVKRVKPPAAEEVVP